MASFTLDTSCLTTLDEDQPDSRAIRALVAAHDAGNANVAFIAISAQKKQKTDAQLIKDFEQFRFHLDVLGLGKLEILRPMAYFDISFLDWCVFPTEELEDIEREIHSILYPSIQYAWRDYRKAHQIEAAIPSKDSPWRAAKCDVQMMLAHIEAERDVFVTSNDIFHREIKKKQLIALGARAIVMPAEAVGMI